MATEEGREEDEEVQGDVAVEAARPELKEPPKYAVILHNDDYTTMEFVIEVLQKFFRKSTEEATRITLQVHQTGKGVAGIYSHEIAETKVMQVTQYARSKGHPLKCTAEPVE
jgi:ATP-dependent Clp protease adaptor protein ClpS